MIIRDALEADLPAIVEIYNEAIRGRISTAQLDEVSVEQRRPWFRTHSASRILSGSRRSRARSRAGSVSIPSLSAPLTAGRRRSAFMSARQFRRRGVGKMLLEKAIAHSADLKLNALVGYIFEHNDPSVRLFEQMGFERWGFLPRVALVDGVDTIMRGDFQAGMAYRRIVERLCETAIVVARRFDRKRPTRVCDASPIGAEARPSPVIIPRRPRPDGSRRRDRISKSRRNLPGAVRLHRGGERR